MKATALEEFLTECRAASTSGAIGQAVDQIEQKTARHTTTSDAFGDQRRRV